MPVDTRECYRRSEFLVAYWRGGNALLYNYATNISTEVTEEDLLLLGRVSRWMAYKELRSLQEHEPLSIFCDRLGRLVEATCIQASKQPLRTAERAFKTWRDWLPSAAFFHQATKDYRPRDTPSTGLLISPTDPVDPLLRRSQSEDDRVLLPPAPAQAVLPELLSSRRTWRRFSDSPLTFQQIAALLGLTWSVQTWVEGEDGRIALKTSPSGGGRHSIEVYLLANDVTGLESGVYHYEPDRHSLCLINRRHGADLTRKLLPGNSFDFQSVKAVFFMTSVFARVQARYRTARAYRNIFIEAGHLAQTFCLVATWLKLAPFCTAALNDSAIEELLGVDGVTQSVVYATGAGNRPPGASWAPWPDSDRLPRTHRPQHQRRFDVET